MKHYLNIENIKNCLTQCFIHTYRNQTYNFLIIDKIDLVFDEHDDLFNFVLNFSIYQQFKMQIIFDLFAIQNQKFLFDKVIIKIELTKVENSIFAEI